MPSHSEAWGGLFKGEQYRLIRCLRDFEQFLMFRPVGLTLRACPSLLRRGIYWNHLSPSLRWLKYYQLVLTA
jgi:hypothetical protein